MQTPRLSRALVPTLASAERGEVELPAVRTLQLPEKIIQFGTGAFLRGFIEYFIDDANRAGRFDGRIVAVSSTGSSRNAAINEQDGLFTLAIRGVEDGAPKQRYRMIGSLNRAISARDEWNVVMDIARNPNIEIVVSNTTEVGIAISPDDAFDAVPPVSFPAKLTRFLMERATAFDFSNDHGLIVLPCELIEQNGDTLRRLVLETASRWKLGDCFERWILDAIVFCNTLVDRIVPGNVTAADAARIERVFGYQDTLITSCEPYALFAIQGDDTLRARLRFPGADPRIVVASDIQPYRERKIRVLNGAHTAVVSVALLAGFRTVREACRDERVGRFLQRVVFEEIVPGVNAPDAAGYAADVLQRFGNPYIDHALIDITLHCAAKIRVRLVPSILAFAARTSGARAPASLAFAVAAYLAFKRGERQAERRAAGLSVPDDVDGSRVEAAWSLIDGSSDADVAGLARRTLTDASLWGVDLTTVPGFADAVAEQLLRIVRLGVEAALDAYLTEPAAA
jgi:tagaturonate reductase